LCLAVTQAAQANVRFRRALPPGFAAALEGDPATQAEFAALADAFHRATREPGAAARAFAEMAERFVLGAARVEEGLAADMDGAAAIDLHPRLRQRPGTLAHLRVERDSVTLFFSGSWLRGPGAIEAPLRYVLAAGTFTPASLPGPLDEESRLALARWLV